MKIGKMKSLKIMHKLCDKAEKHNMLLGFASIGRKGKATLSLEAEGKTLEESLLDLHRFLKDINSKWKVLSVRSELTDHGYLLHRCKLKRNK